MQKGVSIIIASYNGSVRLPETLRHLALQKVPDNLKWEVIVVDNNSTDNTAETAVSEWQKYNTGVPFFTMRETNPGVVYAREKGIKNAKYEYVILCDDDNWLAEDYISKAASILDGNKKIGLAGGQSTGSFEIPPPTWFKDFSTAYAIGSRRDKSTVINWLATAGAVIRKEALQRLECYGFNQILSGPQGKKRSGGEDLELCAAITAAGYDIYFSTELNFVHFMPANRLEWGYLKRLIAGSAKAQSVFDMYVIIDKMLKKNESISFTKVYKKLLKQQTTPISIKNDQLGKAIQFWFSLLSTKEGNTTKYGNKYYVDYALYILFNKRELKLRYNQITGFYSRIKQYRLHK